MSGPWILVFMLEVVLDVIYINEAIIHIFFTDIVRSVELLLIQTGRGRPIYEKTEVKNLMLLSPSSNLFVHQNNNRTA
jgi:hypothetical protein